MANQFTDLQIIECNRLHSEEAKSKNNENFALWQNNLQDIVHLDAGDKVSVHGAMVSERGAGQGSSIEIKGESLGFSKEYNFTVIEERNLSDAVAEQLATKAEIIECNASSQTIEFRDDSLNFTVSYYVPMNGHNYMHLPRRWWLKENDTSGSQWGEADELAAGLSYYNPFKDNFQFYDDYYQISGTDANINPPSGPRKDFFKAKNNNDRYTIMLRDKSYYSASSASGNLEDYPNRDPENAIYRTYKELKNLSIPAGFNSPQFVAEELTRQFQNITDTRTYEYRNDQELVRIDDKYPGYPVRVYKTINTETYKTFNVANFYYDASIEGNLSFNVIERDFNHYINASGSGNNASGYDWLSQYHCIATKRPELYETGRLVNFYEPTAGSKQYRGIFGTTMTGSWFIDELIDISQQYNEENCKIWKDFFDAQALYPEIWNSFSDKRSGYNSGDTPQNSRWFHINAFRNASQSYTGDTAANGNAMLGDSGYILHSWNSDNSKQPASKLCPIYFKESDKDTFYENPDPDEYTYGCIKKNKFNGKIQFVGSLFNGYGTDFYESLLAQGQATVNGTRKCGFDMHFTATGMSYILLYSGWMDRPTSYKTDGQGGVYTLCTDVDATIRPLGLFEVRTYNYFNKLYLGADSPTIDYDGNNFSISNLHTPMNRGNDNTAGNPYTTVVEEFGNAATAEEAGDVVYVINPKETYNDWTPAMKPYGLITKTTDIDSKAPAVKPFNSNLQAWTIYDSLTGIFIDDLKLTKEEWVGSLWDILGFSYKQLNSTNNTRTTIIDNNNVKSLSLITTNAEINQGDSKIYVQNLYGAPLYNNMVGGGGGILPDIAAPGTWAPDDQPMAFYYPEIKQKTQSIKIVADNLPIRMKRGYYTIRSNMLQDTPFIGGKVNNTNMPIIGIVDKINGDGDFYFGQESSLQFTITRPIRLASITCSLHDPDGSYAKCTDQSAVLFKVEKTKNVTFDIAQELLQEQQQEKKK